MPSAAAKGEERESFCACATHTAQAAGVQAAEVAEGVQAAEVLQRGLRGGRGFDLV